MVRRYGRVDLARISLVLPVKQARHRHLLTGGNVPLASEAERNWRTNWPVHVAVFVAAGVEIALAPGGSAIVLALLWAASYGLTHWAYIVRQVRGGGGECGVAMMTVLAMALLTVSDNGLHLFVTFPLIWIMLETFIRGLLATVAAATAMVLVVIWSEGGVNGDVLGSALAMGFGVAAFSIGLAAWIWRVEVRSHERRELVARLSETVSELEAARAELAS